MAKTEANQNQSTASAIDEASLPFIGQWHTLISTTNWEKGRIISEWRAAQEEEGEEVSAYSDEAWARLVGEVTSQHVGRLRRVYDRFGDVAGEYESLYWSHFHAGLDWDDAEIWLEGALQQAWSVSRMRRQRDEAHGKADKASDANVIESRVSNPEGDAELATVADPDGEVGSVTGNGESGETNTDPDMPAAEKSSPPKPRPFKELAELPDDLADAFESMKLAILAHKLTNWEEVPRDDVIASLEALKQLAVAPSE
ncbi:MAG: hypothetical protein ACR2NU_04425 [Aeoliella sp.]